jgi:hypothetical protein
MACAPGCLESNGPGGHWFPWVGFAQFGRTGALASSSVTANSTTATSSCSCPACEVRSLGAAVLGVRRQRKALAATSRRAWLMYCRVLERTAACCQ